MLEVTQTIGGTSVAMDHITEHLCSKVRVFLTEIAEGVSNYRSMHNLTEQVEHQYHGRFLIELIQNAHDALGESSGQGRIYIRFDKNDSEHGSLLVANDGEPFSWSNFEKVSALGQSDKDPQKSIGNKGIGFRSVLELTDCPEIYSRQNASSLLFDGYCFAFRLSTVGSLVLPMTELAFGEGVPAWEMSGKPLVQHWSSEMLTQYRTRVATMGREWLEQEVRYLSPYLLPVALKDRESAALREFEREGFATVVRLPLKSAQAAMNVQQKMKFLEPSTCLFLWNLRELTLDQSAVLRRTFCRTITKDTSGGMHVALTESSGAQRDYLLWRKNVRIAEAPESVGAAVKVLPGRWPEMEEAEVSIAIRSGGEPDKGCVSIYLPTRVLTGSAVHLNAPFYGDMSRTSIEFGNAYNDHLVNVAMDLAVSAAIAQTAVLTADAGRAVLDLLCPLENDADGQEWSECMARAISRARINHNSTPLVLTEGGWAALRDTYQVPGLSTCRFFTDALVRQLAPVALLHPDLTQRRSRQFELLKEQFFRGTVRMPAKDVAGLVASVAEVIHRDGGDWNGFWRDVLTLLPNGQRELSRLKVLLGTDGELHQVEGGMKVFFLPRQGTPDAGDVETDSSTTEVPATLRGSVAFLSDQIELYDARRGNSQNVVREYLGGPGLVTPFRVETIFRDILRELTPQQLPVPHEGDEARRCRDIFSWGLRLMRNIVARGRGAPETFKLLGDLPVPCRGGWYKLKDSTFGSGWFDPAGDLLERYLGGLSFPIGEAAYAKLLLPASHSAFSELDAAATKDLLLKGGASDFLSLHEVASAHWDSSFYSSSALSLPLTPPPGFGQALWSEIVTAHRQVRLPYSGSFQYRVGSLWTFAGLEEYESLSESQKKQLSTLLLGALPRWAGVKWKTGHVFKIGGLIGKAQFETPLLLFLRTCPWLAIQEDRLTWDSPQERWLVPADTLASRARHYAHLRALPAETAAKISAHPGLVDELRSLGMKVFNGRDDTPSTALLEALTASIGTEAVADTNVLLGQLRDAWGQFQPDDTSTRLACLPVKSRRGLQRVQASVENFVVLPDQAALSGTLEDLGLPVLTMQTRAAQRLREWFKANYATTVQFASEMKVEPTVSGIPWSGEGSTPLSESVLSWLITPLLVLVSHERSVHATSFQERHDKLSSAKVAWVSSLELSIVRPNSQPLSKRVSSLWDARSSTLLIDESCRTQLAELSPALAHALEREDLQLPIRFILSAVGKLPDGSPDIVELLKPLGTVGKEEIDHVMEHLRGDVGYAVRYAKVLARAVDPHKDVTDIESAASEEQLLTALQHRGFDSSKCAELIQQARQTNDMFEFGATMAERWPSFPSLVRWNEALRSFQLPGVENKAWRSEFSAILEEFTWIAKRTARHAIACGHNADVGYGVLCATYTSLGQTQKLDEAGWRIRFAHVAGILGSLFGGWLGNSDLQGRLALSQDADEFTRCLEQAGIDLKVDPDELGRLNATLAQSAATQLDRIRLAWMLKHASGSPESESCVDRLLQSLGEELGSSAFVVPWSSEQVFTMLKNSFSAAFPSGGEFAVTLNSACSLEDLRSKLELTEREIEESETNLRSAREAAARRKNVINVCGKEFDASEGNLKNLWDLLKAELPDSALSSGSPFNLDDTMLLEEPPAKSPAVRDKAPSSATRSGRQPKFVNEAVGLAGEIFVFRMLRQRYGEEAVSASAWISENSRYVYEMNPANDGFGCDFKFSVKGRQYRVEVKATQGDADVFSLGSSEITLAMEIAGKTKRKKETFLIVHVKNALSSSPSAVVLPNPYDPASEGLFRIEEAEARVRYRSRKTTASSVTC